MVTRITKLIRKAARWVLREEIQGLQRELSWETCRNTALAAEVRRLRVNVR